MKYLKLFFLSILIFLFANIKAQYSNQIEVFSSGGGESTWNNYYYSNFCILGETFAHTQMTGGNYSTRPGFYPDEIINIEIRDQAFKIYPNPVRNILNIEFITLNNKINKIQLLNTQGQIISAIEKDKLNSNNLQIDLSMCSTGIYYLNIQTDKGAIIKKISVMK